MRTLLGLIFFCFGIVVFSAAGSADFDEWFRAFYKTDNIEKFDGYWAHLMQEKVLENENAVAPVIGFTSQVVHRHPELIVGRFDDLRKFSKAARRAVVAILWYSDTEQGRQVLGDEVEKSRPPEVRLRQIEQASDLDFCWGWFFATGDKSALDPIVATLDLAKYSGSIKRFETGKKTDEDKLAAYKEAIFQAAMWSLNVIGKECPPVVTRLEEVFADKGTTDERRLWLAVVLSKLKPEKHKIETSSGKGARIVVVPDNEDRTAEAATTWKDNEGRPVKSNDSCGSADGFGALLVVTGDADWEKKWETPAEETPRFTPASRIRIGERVMFLVFFASPLPNNEGEIDVVYDVTIRRPNGRTSTEKNIKGFKGKLGGPLNNTYLVDGRMGFEGAAGDPLGDWVFEFNVRDLVRGVAVPLRAKISLAAPNSNLPAKAE